MNDLENGFVNSMAKKVSEERHKLLMKEVRKLGDFSDVLHPSFEAVGEEFLAVEFVGGLRLEFEGLFWAD